MVFPLVSGSTPSHPRPLRRRAGLAAAVAVCLASATVMGQTADPEVLIRDGVALRKQGEDAKAHGYFQRAYDIARTPRTAAQLGLCDLAVGRWLEAEVHLTESLDSSDPWVSNQRTALEQGRSRARAKLGKVIVTGVGPGATVTATGRPPTKLPDDGQVWVSPGSVHLKLEAPGYRSVDQDVVVAEGKRAIVEVQMPPVRKDPPARLEQREEAPSRPTHEVASSDDASAPPAAEPPRRNDRRRHSDDNAWRTPVIWTAASLGVAMLGFGIYETLEYNSRIDAFNDPKRPMLCGDSGGAIAGGPDCQRLATEGDRAKTLAIVGYVGAGVLGVTALVVGLATGSSSGNDVASSSMSCTPAQGGGMQAGVRCALRF